MYQITKENLKYAYLKLKRYVYYNTSSNYLKEKIMEFEDKTGKNDNIFEEYANELNKIGMKNYNCLSGYSIDYVFYPKKDSFEMNKDIINIGKINVFIDMDLLFYLNDILFCFELYNVYKEIDNKHFFGNLFDKHLERCENPLSNNMLFDAYWPNYQKWKKTLTKNVDKKVLKTTSLIKIDFQRCFYQTRFKLEKLLNEFDISIENPIVNIALNVYRYYSHKIYKLTGEKKKEHYVQLPLGLPSSSILQNILFSEFDRKMINNNKIQGYSRYVDDVLILFAGEINQLAPIEEFIEEISCGDNGEVRVDVNSEFLKPLIVNQSKIEIKKGSSIETINEQVEKIILPSMLNTIDEEESEIRSEPDSLEISSNQIYLKRIVNSFFENDLEPKKLVKFINELSDADLLNIYPCWNKIISILKSQDDYLQEFNIRVNNAIGKVKYTNADKFFEEEKISDFMIKKTLTSQLDISMKLNKENQYYLFNVNQNDIFRCLDCAYRENTRMYLPVYVKLEYIELYLSIHQCLDTKDLIKESIVLYEFVNCVKLNENHPANYTEIRTLIDSDLVVEDGEYHLEDKYTSLYSFSLTQNIGFSDDIKVGVMSVQMPEKTIENCDIDSTYPHSYSYNDLIQNIKTAKENGASYIVMPEFCIPNKHVIKILKYCMHKNISLIAGITHVLYEKKAKNYVVIYDCFMKLAIAKQKNYYPYEERKLLAKNGYAPIIDPAYYIRIDNSIIHYSTMTCFEATNIRDRAFLNNKIDMIFIPVYNRDTNYFSDIIGSLSRDLSCFVVQANNSEYGDSRISSPQDSYHKDVIKLKGGDNCFTVVGTINLNKMKAKHSFMERIDRDINNLLISTTKEIDYNKIEDKIEQDKKENSFKPLSAGCSIHLRRKYSLEDES